MNGVLKEWVLSWELEKRKERRDEVGAMSRGNSVLLKPDPCLPSPVLRQNCFDFRNDGIPVGLAGLARRTESSSLPVNVQQWRS